MTIARGRSLICARHQRPTLAQQPDHHYYEHGLDYCDRCFTEACAAAETFDLGELREAQERAIARRLQRYVGG